MFKNIRRALLSVSDKTGIVKLGYFLNNNGVEIISMIAPTSHQRIQMIAREAQGYIYLVSSLGVTGVRKQITTNLAEIVKKIREVSDRPIAVGFGISTPEMPLPSML